MTATTATGQFAKHQKPEDQARMRRLSSALEYNAGEIAVLADRIEQWAETPSARDALGILSKARECSDALRFPIAGIPRGPVTDTAFWSMQRRLDAVPYSLMHALGQFDREQRGELNAGGGAVMCRSGARVLAADVRHVSSQMRVHAGIAAGIANGDHLYFG